MSQERHSFDIRAATPLLAGCTFGEDLCVRVGSSGFIVIHLQRSVTQE